jgi:predicted outer membrane lipoprotein
MTKAKYPATVMQAERMLDEVRAQSKTMKNVAVSSLTRDKVVRLNEVIAEGVRVGNLHEDFSILGAMALRWVDGQTRKSEAK